MATESDCAQDINSYLNGKVFKITVFTKITS